MKQMGTQISIDTSAFLKRDVFLSNSVRFRGARCFALNGIHHTKLLIIHTCAKKTNVDAMLVIDPEQLIIDVESPPLYILHFYMKKIYQNTEIKLIRIMLGRTLQPKAVRGLGNLH